MERWRRFQIKWRLPESTSYSQLLKCIRALLPYCYRWFSIDRLVAERVLRDLRRCSVPNFQVLRLTDLPVEVLDNVINLAPIAQAKILSSTCHLLNNIGQRHIFQVGVSIFILYSTDLLPYSFKFFQSWLTKLRVPPHVTHFNSEYSIIDLTLSAEYSRKDLLKNADFLTKTPHISRRIQSLILADEWWVHRRAHPNENNPFILGMDFYKSAHQIFASVLRCASKLTTLVLRNLELGPEFTRQISEMPTLHTLDLHLCRIPRMVRKRLVLESLPLSWQITNLHIYMDSAFQETHSQWYTLLLCPRIRTLSVVQFGAGTFPALDTLFWQKCELAVLERLSLDNIDYRDLEAFTRWFLARGGDNGNTTATTTNNSGSKTTTPPLLTHFKLHMQWGIPDSDILSLLLALRRAPLEVLVLEGLAEAEFVIFKYIASQYPDLTALTLVRRQNPSQHQNKLVVWPHASWEYASCLRGFKGLRHFCWNFLTEYWDATPRLLLTFEEGFPSGSEKTTTGTAVFTEQNKNNNCDASDDLPYFLDSHWMAFPFAAHCPNLHTFSLMDHSVDMVCLITRGSSTGRTTLTPKYIPIHSFDSRNIQQWNTSSFHWPILLPVTVGCPP